jgi:hypothetical protein
LTKSSGKFGYRQDFSLRLNRLLNIEQMDVETIQRVEARFNVRIVLFSITSFICEYPLQSSLPFSEWKEVICGLLTGPALRKVGHWGHVDFVTMPTAMHPEVNNRVHRFCYYCVRTYKRKVGCNVAECKEDRTPRCAFCHSCGMDACPACNTEECGQSQNSAYADEEECIPFTTRTRCKVCFHKVFSPKCLELHAMTCKAIHTRRCDDCGNKFHPGLNCHEQRCYFCGDKFLKSELGNHKCYIKREKLKVNKTVMATYDFECCIGQENRHVPYLCTVWFPEGHPREDELVSKYPFDRRSDGTPVFVFWGLGDKEEGTGVYQFFHFCADPLLQGTVFWAHNARAYDAVLVKCYFAKYMKRYSIDIARGLKLMSMHYEDFGIDFRDSLSFIPSSLRAMSDDFGIQVTTELGGVVDGQHGSGKDFFPHSYVTEEYLQACAATDFVMPKPPMEAFIPDYRSGRAGNNEEKEFLQWIDNNYNQWGDTWNVKSESVKYCIKDTVLLGKVLIKFRDQLAEMTQSIERPQGVTPQPFDALAYITLPSAMMSFYLSQMIEPETIGVIHASTSIMRRESEAWFLYLEDIKSVVLSDRPSKPPANCFFSPEFDPFCQAYTPQGVMYVYLDCYDRGCLQCHVTHQRNIVKNRSFGELWYSTSNELMRLKSICGSDKVISIWSHEWEKISSTEEVREWYEEERIEEFLPLFPRDAYKGGKVECFKICYPGEIQMSDFVSQYPTTLLGESYDPLDLDGDPQATLEWPFPIGLPEMEYMPSPDRVQNMILTTDHQGIIKCRVVCPSSLYAPFLGYKVKSLLCAQGYEVLYGSCRSCMENRGYDCTHTSTEDRSIMGTWTIAEVRYAIKDLGYKLVAVIEVWEYKESSKSLFRNFIAPFMVEKIRSKRDGLVDADGQFTPRGTKLNDYIFELVGRRLTEDEIEDNPARRQVAKLAQNSFTGKWGEIEVHRTVRTFNENQTDESRKLLTDPSVNLIFAEVLDEEGNLIVIEYEPKFKCSRSARRKNDIIVAHITAYGRTMLSRLDQVLGQDLLYEDTDSAFHAKLLEPRYRDGYRTGDLELELKSGSKWVCCGRKWYSYMKGDQAVNKIKGFTLKRSNAHLFEPEKLFKLFVECKEAYDQRETDTIKEFNRQEAPVIEVEQTLFKTVKERKGVSMWKETSTSFKRAQFQIGCLKRQIKFPDHLEPQTFVQVDTVPFGFRE